MALNKQASKPPGKSKSIPSAEPSLLTDSQQPSALTTSGKSAATTSPPSTSSLAASPVKTSAPWAAAPDSPAHAPDYSGKSYASSKSYGPNGWCLKTSLGCSLAKLAETSKRVLKRLPRAGMWDFGACLMLQVSEFPKDAAAFSWSQVLDDNPPLSCWLTPNQLSQYLARLARSSSHGQRMDGLPVLFWPKTQTASSVSVVKLLSLTKEDGVRWLSGPESLKMQGFASDWMRPTIVKLGLQATPSPFRSPGGSPKS